MSTRISERVRKYRKASRDTGLRAKDGKAMVADTPCLFENKGKDLAGHGGRAT